jgi:oligosaccharyltransferase complex subunit alpha (ribophorin I)
MVPFPEEIAQSDNQLVVYTTTLQWYSPYKTESQSTDIILPSAAVESYTETAVTAKGNLLTYGE